MGGGWCRKLLFKSVPLMFGLLAKKKHKSTPENMSAWRAGYLCTICQDYYRFVLSYSSVEQRKPSSRCQADKVFTILHVFITWRDLAASLSSCDDNFPDCEWWAYVGSSEKVEIDLGTRTLFYGHFIVADLCLKLVTFCHDGERKPVSAYRPTSSHSSSIKFHLVRCRHLLISWKSKDQN